MTNPPRPFAMELFHEILKDIYAINPGLKFHYEISQQPQPSGIGTHLKQIIRNLMRRFRTVRVDLDNHSLRTTLSQLDPYWDGLQFLYEHLADDESRYTLVKVIEHRILGALHVILPADTPQYEELFRRAQTLEDRTDSVDSGFRGCRLHRMKLDSYGFPMTVMANAFAVQALFGMKQYEYCNGKGRLVGPQPGDLVIDGGSCWGDSALFFANAVGPDGKVLAFEFVPQNLALFQKNMDLNPTLAERVTLVQHPLWDKAGETVSIESDGPASQMKTGTAQNAGSTILTSTIDQVISDRQSGPVGFIKMDIEGAELPALRGAVETLKRDRPRLAISLYHSLDDFVRIPRWIADLNLGYRFYLSHKTIFDAETILFAVAT